MKNVIVKTCKTLLLPVIVYAIFLAVDFDRFSNVSCIYTIFLQSIIPAITAYAVSFGYICGIFDFTVGSRIIISGLVGGILSAQYGMPGLIIGCMTVSILLAAVTGLANWLLKIPSLVLTMALTMIYEIVGKNISGQFSFVSINYDYAYLGAAPYIIIILVLSAAIFYFIYNQTRFSYHMRAVGSNENVARNSGIRTQLVKWLSFVLGGIFVGISAILTISQSGSMGAQVNLGSVTLFFKPLMGILIALVMQRFCNMTFGIFISQLMINTIFIGLIAIGMPDTFQNVILGFFLLVVMVLSNNIDRVKAFLRKKKNRIAEQPQM